jgi:hypothetical protein
MRDVVTMANLMGKYDAADWITRNFFDRPSDYVPPGGTHTRRSSAPLESSPMTARV